MAEYQLGRTLTTEQAATLAAFLGSLTGTIPSGDGPRPTGNAGC